MAEACGALSPYLPVSFHFAIRTFSLLRLFSQKQLIASLALQAQTINSSSQKNAMLLPESPVVPSSQERWLKIELLLKFHVTFFTS